MGLTGISPQRVRHIRQGSGLLWKRQAGVTKVDLGPYDWRVSDISELLKEFKHFRLYHKEVNHTQHGLYRVRSSCNILNYIVRSSVV